MMLEPDNNITEMSEEDAMSSDEYDMEELWWFICQMSAGRDPDEMTTDQDDEQNYGVWWGK